MRASFLTRSTRAHRGRTSALRRVRVAVTTAVLASVAVAAVAEARLSIIPGRPGGPRPTATPQVIGSKSACQERLRASSAALATGVRAAFAECMRVALPCLFDQGGAASCCAAATPGCVREAEEIAAAGAAFVGEVVSPACAAVPFAELAGENGLDLARTADACLRLDPPIAVDGLGSLATCVERLVTQDVLHLAATVEQPRAVEALVCMDLENLFPGLLRERPATCEELPAATPTPTPAPTPTAATSPGGSPTPGASPGGATPTPTVPGATPTPGGATPTPQPTGGNACTQIDVSVAVTFNAVDFPDVSGLTVTVGYPTSLSIPGFGNQPTVLERVSNTTGVQGGLFSVGDQDAQNLLNIGLISVTAAIPAGDFARVRFDCAQGASAPAPNAFTCAVDATTIDGNQVAPTQCAITVAAP